MRALTASLLLALVPTTAVAQPAAQTPRREVLMLGSSSVNGAAGRTIDDQLESWGFDLTRRARGASGFARPDFYDWQAQISDLPPLERYALVLVLVGGNDVQSLRAADGGWIRWQDEVAWTEEYERRVRVFIDALCAGGAPRVVMLLPVDGGRPHWSTRIVRVRRSQARGARASRCGVAIDAGADEFDALDGVHLSWRGARRMWSRIEDAMRLLLALDEA